jgi:hypothetical protein
MLLGWSVRVSLLALMLPVPLSGAQTARSYDEGERHYAAVLGRPADPCPDDSVVSHDACMDKELTFVGPHLDGFVTALRGILGARASVPKRRCAERTQELEYGRCGMEAVPQPSLQPGIQLFQGRQWDDRCACQGRLRAEDGSSVYGATPRINASSIRSRDSRVNASIAKENGRSSGSQ